VSDLVVNPTKNKQLTNMRASGTDEAIRLTPIRKMTLEDCLDYIGDDEYVEVTPQNLSSSSQEVAHREVTARRMEVRRMGNMSFQETFGGFF
jgi:GTP-binding protein